MWPGWLGSDQPRPEAFDNRAAAPATSPTRAEQSHLPSSLLGTARQRLLRRGTRQRRRITTRHEPPQESSERRIHAPGVLQPRRQVRAAEFLGPECRAVEEPPAPVRRTHQPGGGLVRPECGRPVTLVGQRLTPRQACLRSLRRPRQPLETVHTIRTRHSLSEPPLLVALPFVRRRFETSQALHPQWEERTQIRQRTGRHLLHVLDRTEERTQPLRVLDGGEYGSRPLGEWRGGVDAGDILRHTDVGVDPKDFLHELVLAEVDLGTRHGNQDHLEDRAGTDMISRQECLHGPAQILGRVGRIGIAEMARRLDERLRLFDQPVRRATGPKAGGALRGTGHEQVDGRRPRLLVKRSDRRADGGPKLGRGHGLQRPVDIRVRGQRTAARAPTATAHGVLEDVFDSRRRVAVAICA